MIRIHIKKGKWNGSVVSSICRYDSKVIAIVDGKEYNAKSIMSASKLMEAEDMEIMIDGEDENQVEKAIKALIW